MQITLPYGADTMSADVPWATFLDPIDIADTPPVASPAGAVMNAINNPIGQSAPLGDQVKPGQKITIITSDSFRVTRSDQFLAPVVQTLNDTGVTDEDITFLIATGTHRGPTPEELERILGEDLFPRFKDKTIVSDAHDESTHAHLGDTSRGTPVWLHRAAVDADYVIVTGAVVLHYFGGFGGGRKAILPGIASVKTIASNHSMNLHPERDELNADVAIGKTDGNPVAEDMLEGAKMLGANFLVNTVLNRHKEIAQVFAGDIEEAHAAACDFARDMFTVPIDERADLVIASSGPIQNFVQTHKALFNAYQAVKSEGRIILLCECPEGIGGDQFKKWLRLGDRASIIAGLRANAEINGQTALSSIEKGAITTFVTAMSEDDVALLKGDRASTLEEALAHAKDYFDSEGIAEPTCRVMPSAAYTVPISDQRSLASQTS